MNHQHDSNITELEKAISTLAAKISGKPVHEIEPVNDSDIVGKRSANTMDQDSDELKKMRLEHERQMAQIRFEMERLEQTQKLEKLKMELDAEKKVIHYSGSVNVI